MCRERIILNQAALDFNPSALNEATWIVNISAENIPILLFEFIVFNSHDHTTTRKLRRICCCGTKPELTLLERLFAWDLKVEWEHLFHTILKWFRRKNNLRRLRTTPKGRQRNKLILLENIFKCGAFHTPENRKYSLTLDNFSLSAQQLVPNYFLYPSKGSDVSERFWPNFHQINTPSRLAAIWRSLRPVWSRGKDGLPRTTRGPS